MNEYDKNKPKKPIIFEIPNTEFLSHYSIYESNIVEFWKPITTELISQLDPNDNGRYWVSSWGRIYDSKYQYLLPLVSTKGNKYYEQVNFRDINRKNFTVKVHRLVLLAFMPVKDSYKYQGNHIDGLHSNNDLRNLEWCTAQYNRYHSMINNLEDSVFNSKMVKLYPFEVRKIKELKELGYSNSKIIELLDLKRRGAHESLISQILHGKSIYSTYLN